MISTAIPVSNDSPILEIDTNLDSACPKICAKVILEFGIVVASPKTTKEIAKNIYTL